MIESEHITTEITGTKDKSLWGNFSNEFGILNERQIPRNIISNWQTKILE